MYLYMCICVYVYVHVYVYAYVYVYICVCARSPLAQGVYRGSGRAWPCDAVSAQGAGFAGSGTRQGALPPPPLPPLSAMFHGGAPPLRRRKTAADRRSQRLRAEGRGAQRLLRAFAAVQECRGGQLTPLAEALSRALGDGGRSASGHAAGEVPVPMTQREIVHVQTVIQQERIQQHVEMVVEVPVPMMQEEEIVHVPPIIQQARIHQQQVEMVVEAPVPMTQEESVSMNVHSSHGASDAVSYTHLTLPTN